jgi:hypothetical protein
MVYSTQNCWVFGLCLSSGILSTRKHNVSETGSVSETLWFLVSRISDDGQSPKTQQFWEISVCTSLSTGQIECRTYCMRHTSIFHIQSWLRFLLTEGVPIFWGSYYEWRCLPQIYSFDSPFPSWVRAREKRLLIRNICACTHAYLTCVCLNKCNDLISEQRWWVLRAMSSFVSCELSWTHCRHVAMQWRCVRTRHVSCQGHGT